MSKYVKLANKYDAEIVEEKYNALIGRIEVLLKLSHLGEGTPARALIKQELARIYNKEPELVFIRKIHTEHGLPVSFIEAHVYDNTERARKFEPEYIVKRDEESLSRFSQAASG